MEPRSNPESSLDPVPQPPHFLWLVFGLQWESRSGIQNRGDVDSGAERLLGCERLSHWVGWRKQGECLVTHSGKSSGVEDEEIYILWLCIRPEACFL